MVVIFFILIHITKSTCIVPRRPIHKGIGSGYNLVPKGDKPLSETVLTHFTDAHVSQVSLLST